MFTAISSVNMAEGAHPALPVLDTQLIRPGEHLPRGTPNKSQSHLLRVTEGSQGGVLMGFMRLSQRLLSHPARPCARGKGQAGGGSSRMDKRQGDYAPTSLRSRWFPVRTSAE